MSVNDDDEYCILYFTILTCFVLIKYLCYIYFIFLSEIYYIHFWDIIITSHLLLPAEIKNKESQTTVLFLY